MTEHEIVVEYLTIKHAFAGLGYYFAILTPTYGFTAYNKKGEVFKFFSLEGARDKLEEMRGHI